LVKRRKNLKTVGCAVFLANTRNFSVKFYTFVRDSVTHWITSRNWIHECQWSGV